MRHARYFVVMMLRLKSRFPEQYLDHVLRECKSLRSLWCQKHIRKINVYYAIPPICPRMWPVVGMLIGWLIGLVNANGVLAADVVG